MIVEYVRYRLKPESTEGFLAAYRVAANSLAASPHCQHYELARCTEEPDRFVLRIHWTSLEGHLEGFRKSEEFRTFLAAVRPYIDDIDEMQHYEPTDVVTRQSIYDAVGGAATMFRLARHFHEAMSEDPVLAPLFAHAADSHVPHLAMWLCEVFGGPKLYSQTLDDIAPMLRRHARLDITEPQRRALRRVGHSGGRRKLESRITSPTPTPECPGGIGTAPAEARRRSRSTSHHSGTRRTSISLTSTTSPKRMAQSIAACFDGRFTIA